MLCKIKILNCMNVSYSNHSKWSEAKVMIKEFMYINDI